MELVSWELLKHHQRNQQRLQIYYTIGVIIVLQIYYNIGAINVLVRLCGNTITLDRLEMG